MATVKRKYRVTLDFELDLGEVTDDVVNDVVDTFTNAAEVRTFPWFHEGIARNRRMMAILKADPELIDRMYKFSAMAMIRDGALEFDDPPDFDLLESDPIWDVVAQLPEADRKLFDLPYRIASIRHEKTLPA